MYTKTSLFSTYIAASPTVWWNKDYLIRQPEVDFCGREDPVDSPVSLILAWGVSKENLTRFAGESEASFERRQGNAEESQIREYMEALAKRLQGCKSIRSVHTREFPHEDHGSIAVAALQHGLTLFLLE
jgi:predicted alpha/beta superfamily hydrolase